MGNHNQNRCDFTETSTILSGLRSSESYVIQMQEVNARIGVPLSCVVPVKNYSEELELDMNCDILLLTAVNQMLRFADNYFDEISDRFSNIETKE